MHTPRRLPSLLLTILLVGPLMGCGGERSGYDGYLEADLVLVGAQQPGRITELTVTEGDTVETGQRLALVDADAAAADADAAAARLDQARAQLADALDARQRPEEIAALEASREAARVTLANAQDYLDRIEPLAPDAIPAQELDNARAARDRARAQLAEIDRRIAAARDTARQGQVEAARAAVSEAEASLARARTALERYGVTSPAAGSVEEVYFRPGEVIGAGQPVLALMPPGNLKVRFYVPETALSSLSRGDRVSIACDGCPDGLTAEIRFIAREAEFTPPVILSEQRRDKLVFMVEAVPQGALSHLPAGLPVTVSRHDGE